MEIRDSAAERAKAIEVAIERFTRRKLPVPEYLLKLAGKKAEPTPEPAPEPTPEPVAGAAPEPQPEPEPEPAPESDVKAAETEPEAAPDSDAEEAVEKVEKPVVRRGRPRR